jgi:hypothetical protein
MKKALAAFSALVILSFSVMAFANGGGMMGGGMMGGGMMGGGMMDGGMMDGGMMGSGNGYGYGYSNDKETKEFMEKTAEMRRELNRLRFEFNEAYRSGDEVKARKLFQQIEELTYKIRQMAPKNRSY